MIYTVYADEYLLYNPALDDYIIYDTDLHLKDNWIGEFAFTIEDDHPSFSHLIPMVSRIKIYRNGTLVFLGRIKRKVENITHEWNVVCESCIGFLNDSMIRPFEYSGSVSGFFRYLLNSHNEQVNENQQFAIGDCTVEDSNDYIVRSSADYLKTFEVFESRIFELLGGHLVVSFDVNEKPILSLMASLDVYSTQHIQFGENLVDFERGLLYDTFYTACIPLGARDEETNVALTVTDVNEGKDYIINTQLAETYGVVFAPVEETTWDDVTLASNLLSKGQAWLATKGVVYKQQVYMDAEDISSINANVDSFWFLQNVYFDLFDGTTVSYLLSDFSVDITDPESLIVVLNDSSSQYVDYNLSSQVRENENNNSKRIGEINADYVSSGQARILTEETIRTSTTIDQKVNQIILGVLEEYTTQTDVETISSRIASAIVTQLADSVDLRFTQTQTEIDGLGQHVNTIETYFVVRPATQQSSAGLYIGESDYEIKIKVGPTGVYFYRGSMEDVDERTALSYYKYDVFVAGNTIQIGAYAAPTHWQFKTLNNGDFVLDEY